jgi:CRISPR-associated endonuclease/helicase Cas3
MEGTLFAHSKNRRGETQLLETHLVNTANQCKEFAEDFESEEIGFSLGLLHDIGKLDNRFQQKLLNQDDSIMVDHKFCGSVLAAKYFQPLAYVIACHHGGLRDFSDFKLDFREKQECPHIAECLKTAETILNRKGVFLFGENGAKDMEIPDSVQRFEKKVDLEFYLRMLFSCLVDADFLDTERHFNPELAEQREVTTNIASLIEQFLEFHSAIPKTPSAVNDIRRQVYEYCLDAAGKDQGFYRLMVPTGGGKTLSSLAFALRHADTHHLKRIIYAIPYTSIIDQIASEFKRIFDDTDVLEHHSAFAIEESEEFEVKSEKWRLAAENWDFPLVVTTTVQLFESIFSNKIAKLRKLHNLSRSVIILDEVQNLPVRLLNPILDVLQQLVKYYQTSIVLCTATQPAFEENLYLKGIKEPVKNIVKSPETIYTKLKRVKYEFPALAEKWTWNKVANQLRESTQAMAVVNTKRDAIVLFEKLADLEYVYHLSTLLCGAHRRDVLDRIRELLNGNAPCILIATQVVEAGVDIDFPMVMRAIGPLDNIVQAAGRCNREGKMEAPGRVIVFDPEGGGFPKGDYKTATGTCISLLRSGADLDSPQIYAEYFRRIYQGQDTDKRRIQSAREGLQFTEVAKRFRMIEDDTQSLVVNYYGLDGKDESQNSILSKVQHLPFRQILRQLQPYLVNVRTHLFGKLEQEGWTDELAPGIHKWLGEYDSRRGIVTDEIDPEKLIY